MTTHDVFLAPQSLLKPTFLSGKGAREPGSLGKWSDQPVPNVNYIGDHLHQVNLITRWFRRTLLPHHQPILNTTVLHSQENLPSSQSEPSLSFNSVIGDLKNWLFPVPVNAEFFINKQ